MFNVNVRSKKKLGRPHAGMGEHKLPVWRYNSHKKAERAAVLAEKFEAIKDRPVIHWKPPTYQSWVTNLQRQPVGMIDLNADVWGQEIRKDLVHRVVRWQRNCWRQGTASAQSRSEVNGSTKKLRAQKGSGKARIGSRKSPVLIGGGVAHPPKPRDWSYELPEKVRNLAMRVVLSAKFKENNLFVIEDTMLDTHKTGELIKLMQDRWGDIQHDLIAVLTAPNELDPNFALAARNIWNFDFYTPDTANVFDLVKRHRLIVTRSGIEAIEAQLMAKQDKIKFQNENMPVVNLATAPPYKVFRHKRKQVIAARQVDMYRQIDDHKMAKFAKEKATGTQRLTFPSSLSAYRRFLDQGGVNARVPIEDKKGHVPFAERIMPARNPNVPHRSKDLTDKPKNLKVAQE